jgi:uncharacterized protein YkwD
MKFIKNHFWPHHLNQYRPHTLKLPLAFMAAVSVLGMQFSPLPGNDVLGATTSAEKNKIIKLTNVQRKKAGLKPLKENQKLNQAAYAKAKDMLEKNYWAHYSPQGVSPWKFIEDSGYYYKIAGENLAKGFDTQKGVMAGWMNSPGHRKNILNKSYTETGVAVIVGRLDGKDITLVVAMYASPQPLGMTVPGPIQGTTLPLSSQYSIKNPLNPLKTMSWSTWVLAIMFALLGFLYLSQHIIYYKKRLAWVHATHQNPLMQAAIFGGLIVVLLQSGFGAVG